MGSLRLHCSENRTQSGAQPLSGATQARPVKLTYYATSFCGPLRSLSGVGWARKQHLKSTKWTQQVCPQWLVKFTSHFDTVRGLTTSWGDPSEDCILRRVLPLGARVGPFLVLDGPKMGTKTPPQVDTTSMSKVAGKINQPLGHSHGPNHLLGRPKRGLQNQRIMNSDVACGLLWSAWLPFCGEMGPKWTPKAPTRTQ